MSAALTPARILPAAAWLEEAHAITVPVPGVDAVADGLERLTGEPLLGSEGEV